MKILIWNITGWGRNSISLFFVISETRTSAKSLSKRRKLKSAWNSSRKELQRDKHKGKVRHHPDFTFSRNSWFKLKCSNILGSSWKILPWAVEMRSSLGRLGGFTKHKNWSPTSQHPMFSVLVSLEFGHLQLKMSWVPFWTLWWKIGLKRKCHSRHSRSHSTRFRWRIFRLSSSKWLSTSGNSWAFLFRVNGRTTDSSNGCIPETSNSNNTFLATAWPHLEIITFAIEDFPLGKLGFFGVRRGNFPSLRTVFGIHVVTVPQRRTRIPYLLKKAPNLDYLAIDAYTPGSMS